MSDSKMTLQEIVAKIPRRDSPRETEGPVTRGDLERRAKDEAEEEAKQEAQKAYDETYTDACEEAYQRILDGLLDEYGFSD